MFSFLSALLASLFADKVETLTRYAGSSRYELRVVTKWNGTIRSVEVVGRRGPLWPAAAR